jgi:hypothetical protein
VVAGDRPPFTAVITLRGTSASAAKTINGMWFQKQGAWWEDCYLLSAVPRTNPKGTFFVAQAAYDGPSEQYPEAWKLAGDFARRVSADVVQATVEGDEE